MVSHKYSTESNSKNHSEFSCPWRTCRTVQKHSTNTQSAPHSNVVWYSTTAEQSSQPSQSTETEVLTSSHTSRAVQKQKLDLARNQKNLRDLLKLRIKNNPAYREKNQTMLKTKPTQSLHGDPYQHEQDWATAIIHYISRLSLCPAGVSRTRMAQMTYAEILRLIKTHWSDGFEPEINQDAIVRYIIRITTSEKPLRETETIERMTRELKERDNVVYTSSELPKPVETVDLTSATSVTPTRPEKSSLKPVCPPAPKKIKRTLSFADLQEMTRPPLESSDEDEESSDEDEDEDEVEDPWNKGISTARRHGEEETESEDEEDSTYTDSPSDESQSENDGEQKGGFSPTRELRMYCGPLCNISLNDWELNDGSSPENFTKTDRIIYTLTWTSEPKEPSMIPVGQTSKEKQAVLCMAITNLCDRLGPLLRTSQKLGPTPYTVTPKLTLERSSAKLLVSKPKVPIVRLAKLSSKEPPSSSSPESTPN